MNINQYPSGWGSTAYQNLNHGELFLLGSSSASNGVNLYTQKLN
jgi:hypothetical protein